MDGLATGPGWAGPIVGAVVREGWVGLVGTIRGDAAAGLGMPLRGRWLGFALRGGWASLAGGGWPRWWVGEGPEGRAFR
jgi:hypothetical protein